MTVKFDRIEDSLTKCVLYRTVYRGLKIFVLPKPGFSTTYAVYATKYGSVNNAFRFKGKTYEVPEGIAHFLEHKMFEKEDGDTFARYATVGANANAYTGFGETAYLFSATEHVEEALEILVDMVNTPYFTEETVKKEQGIIGEEIDMCRDSAGNRCFFNLMACLFPNHPVHTEIVGTRESIARITPELLYTCYDAFYNPANMALCICGNIDPQRVIAILEKGMRNAVPEQVEPIPTADPDTLAQNRMTEKMEIARPIFEIGIKDLFRTDDPLERLRHQVCCDLILDAAVGRATPFFEDLYNKGLIRAPLARESQMTAEYGYLSVGGESGDPDRVEDAFCRRLDTVCREGIGEDALARMRRKYYGVLMNTFDNPESLASFCYDYDFRGLSMFDIFYLCRDLTMDEVNRHLQFFRQDRMATSLILPNRM